MYKSTNSPFAREVIERIAAIYAIEARSGERVLNVTWKGVSFGADRSWNALKTRLAEVVDQLSSPSPLTQAINYMLNHWSGLTLFLTDARVEVERPMRPIAENGSILASLVMTAKLDSVHPQTYLTDALERIVSGRTKSHQLHELLVWNWKAARERTERAAA